MPFFWEREQFKDPPRMIYPVGVDFEGTEQRLPRLVDVLGLSDAAHDTVDTLIAKIKTPDEFGENPLPGKSHREDSRAYLFYGPPGTGKSMLARAIAREVKGKYADVIEIIPEEILKGDPPANIRRLEMKIGRGANELVNRLRPGSRFFGRRESRVSQLVVILDEFEQMTISRKGEAFEMDSNRYDLTLAFMRMIDNLKTKRNITFIFTSNFKKHVDAAQLSRLHVLQFHKLTPEHRRHVVLSAVNEVMASVNDSKKYFDGRFVDAMNRYRKHVPAYEKAFAEHDQDKMDKYGAELQRIYKEDLDEFIGPSVDAADGLDARQLVAAMYQALDHTVLQLKIQKRKDIPPINGLSLESAFRQALEQQLEQEDEEANDLTRRIV